jgi:anti-sigma factor ChrR (cupin superfamily)
MTPDNEQLMAYVDGELDAEARARFERALAADPALARRVAAQRALRARLVAGLNPQLTEPVPERLLQTARTAPAGEAPVATLSSWRERGRSAPRTVRVWALPVALAASLLLAGVLAVALWRAPGAAGVALQDGQLVARGPVAGALSTALVNSQAADATVQIGLSFRDHTGRLCRTFMVHAQGSAGIACRAGADWLIERVAVAPAEPGVGDGLRMAASGWPASIMSEVEQRIDGEALDAAGEERARARGWVP